MASHRQQPRVSRRVTKSNIECHGKSLRAAHSVTASLQYSNPECHDNSLTETWNVMASRHSNQECHVKSLTVTQTRQLINSPGLKNMGFLFRVVKNLGNGNIYLIFIFVRPSKCQKSAYLDRFVSIL